MNGKRKLTALLLTFCLLAHAAAVSPGRRAVLAVWLSRAGPTVRTTAAQQAAPATHCLQRDACADRGPHAGAHRDANAPSRPSTPTPQAHRDANA